MSKSKPASTSASLNDRIGSGALSSVASLIRSGKARNIVVLTGAGISTSAGIPDFRSPDTGLYANLQALDLPFPEAVFELNFFKRNPKPFWTLAKELYPGKHYPTPTHYFLTLLHSKSLLRRVFSQNIDTLDLIANLPPHKIVEAHGSFATAHCLKCRESIPTEYVLQAGVRRGEVVRCPEKHDGRECGGLVKPDIVFFGEGLPDRFFERIPDLKKADLIIVIGTSLQVQPFASLPDHSARPVPRLLINREAVGPFEALESASSQEGGINAHLARLMGRAGSRDGDMFWKGDADDGVWELCRELGWEEELRDMVKKGREELDRKWNGSDGAEKTRPVIQSGSASGDVTRDNEEGVARSKEEEDSDGGAEESKADKTDHKDLRGSSRTPENESTAAERAKKAGEAVAGVVGKSDTEETDVDNLQKAIEKDLKLGS